MTSQPSHSKSHLVHFHDQILYLFWWFGFWWELQICPAFAHQKSNIHRQTNSQQKLRLQEKNVCHSLHRLETRQGQRLRRSKSAHMIAIVPLVLRFEEPAPGVNNHSYVSLSLVEASGILLITFSSTILYWLDNFWWTIPQYLATHSWYLLYKAGSIMNKIVPVIKTKCRIKLPVKQEKRE